MLTKKEIQEKRAQANQIPVTFHLGKEGVTDAAVAELLGQLRKRKIVKARLLPGATAEGTADDSVAAALAKATASTLIEVRGHTAVYYRP